MAPFFRTRCILLHLASELKWSRKLRLLSVFYFSFEISRACWLLSRPNWRIVSKLTTDVVTYCTEASNQKSKHAYRKTLFYRKSTDNNTESMLPPANDLWHRTMLVCSKGMLTKIKKNLSLRLKHECPWFWDQWAADSAPPRPATVLKRFVYLLPVPDRSSLHDRSLSLLIYTLMTEMMTSLKLRSSSCRRSCTDTFSSLNQANGLLTAHIGVDIHLSTKRYLCFGLM